MSIKGLTVKTPFLLYIVLYRVMLDLIYFNAISPRFSYSGFIDNRSLHLLIISWIVLFVFYFAIRNILDTNSKMKSHIIILILFMVSFIPFTSCIYAGIISCGFIIYNTVYWTILLTGTLYATRISISSFPILKAKGTIITDGFLKYIGLISLVFVIYISYSYTNFRLNFNLFEVYDIRLAARGYSFSTIVSYLFSWTRLIIPLLLGVCILQKKYSLAGLYLVVQMLNFSIDGLKSTFFMALLVIGVTFFFRQSTNKYSSKIIVMGLLSVLFCCCLEIVLANSYYINDLFVRRVLYVPNLLGENYYDFFSCNQPDYFRSSFLRHFGFQSPYKSNNLDGFTFWIGDIYYNKPSMNCNNGLSSDALANLGILGCIITPIFLLLFLRLFDKSTINVEKSIVITPAIYLSYTLLSTTLTTVLLTHGGFLIILIMVLVGNNYKQKSKHN